ncbi:MAG TPA: response regulator [Methylophaga aminisulfidivorans]|uniref:histidine kinase n=2 Tax=root TaxID=1 RepID=A0A7C1ZU41_9GAMM|nr:response regulator [Methylophaga aminisulfidivorans]
MDLQRRWFLPKRAKAIALWALLVMLCGLSFSILGFIELQKISQQRLFLETEKNVRARIEQIQTNIDISLDSLTNVANLYQARGDISTEQLERIFDTETHYHAGTRGLAWVPKIRARELVAFEQRVRSEGMSDFHVYEVTGHGMPRAVNDNTVYFPVRAVYPPLGTDLKYGLNLAAVATRQHVMRKAFNKRATAITDRVSIFYQQQHLYGFQAFHPLFDKQQNLLGYVVGLYDFKGLFGDVFTKDGVELALYDSSTSSQQFLFTKNTSLVSVDQLRKSKTLHWTFPLQVADKQWLISVFPSTNTKSSFGSFMPYVGLVLGTLITSLLSVYLFLSFLRAQQLSEMSTNLAGTHQQLDIQKHLKQVADEANEAKSTLLRAASHDLRQPLHTIGLLTGLLKQSQHANQQQLLANKINVAVENMNGMFGALLDLSQLDAGKLSTNITAFPVEKVLDKLVIEFEMIADDKSLDFHYIYSSAAIKTDKHLLERMLRNILTNAIRYTRRGRIILGCRRHSDFLRICVFDTGIGINEDARDHISQAFYRDDEARKMADNGLGLGLSIVSKTAQTLTLNFDFSSQEGKGSLFYIDVPYANEAISTNARPVNSTANDSLHLDVWLIEDDADTRYGMQQLLTSWQCHSQIFADKQSVKNYLDTGPTKPNVILADYHLIEENGVELSQLISAYFNQAIPILIITASVELEEELQQAKMNVLIKPVKPEHLHQWLQDVVV